MGRKKIIKQYHRKKDKRKTKGKQITWLGKNEKEIYKKKN